MLDIVALPGFLPPDCFDPLLQKVREVSVGERVHLPGHKRGATVSYESLQAAAPELVELYRSNQVCGIISQLAGEQVQPTPLHDQSSCSILIYDRPGDHIAWHYDWNFYKGRHFTALLSFVNEDAAGAGPSAAVLVARSPSGEKTVPTPPNTLVLFEGRFVRHCVRPLRAGETRIILSMTFCTNPDSSRVSGALRRFKDIAYFGPRALWT